MFRFFKRKSKSNEITTTPNVEVVEQNSPATEEIDELTKKIIESSALKFIQEGYTDGLTHDKIKILSITKIEDSQN